MIRVPQSLVASDQTYDIPYFYINDWLDDTGSTAEKVLSLVLKVASQLGKEKNNLIACHCASGVGRTGIFRAAYSLIDDIRRQKAHGAKSNDIVLSIDKVVGQLSIQRPYMVGTAAQYATLYDIVDRYMEHYFETES